MEMCTKGQCKKLHVHLERWQLLVNNIRLSIEEKINSENKYKLNQRDDGLA